MANMGNAALALKNPLSHFTNIYPARWNFYVSSIHEPIYRLYTVHGNKLKELDLRPFTSEFAFGLSRRGKIIAYESNFIANDTAFMRHTTKQVVSMSFNGDINDHINPSTIKYNTYQSQNVRYLSGQLLLTIEACPSWQERRAQPEKQNPITIIPLNIIPSH